MTEGFLWTWAAHAPIHLVLVSVGRNNCSIEFNWAQGSAFVGQSGRGPDNHWPLWTAVWWRSIWVCPHPQPLLWWPLPQTVTVCYMLPTRGNRMTGYVNKYVIAIRRINTLQIILLFLWHYLTSIGPRDMSIWISESRMLPRASMAKRTSSKSAMGRESFLRCSLVKLMMSIICFLYFSFKYLHSSFFQAFASTIRDILRGAGKVWCVDITFWKMLLWKSMTGMSLLGLFNLWQILRSRLLNDFRNTIHFLN